MGSLCAALEAEPAGLPLTRLTSGYLSDLVEWERVCAEQADEDDLNDALEEYE